MSCEKLIDVAKKCGHKAVGLTDHGTVSGAINFIKKCRAAEIKPILGGEFYICRNMQFKSSKEQPERRKGNRHLNLFAKNYAGYQNLCTLSQRASLDGFYYDPRIDYDLLSEFSDGLICSTACLKNLINWNLVIDKYDRAKKAASLFKDIFGDDFYLEVMFHGIPEQAKIIPDIQRLSKELDIKMIVSNDCHYEKKEDAKYHEMVTCMSQKKCVKDPSRHKQDYPEFYYKSTEEMSKIFNHMPQAMINTMEIVEKCDLSELRFGGMNLPKFEIPEDFKNPYSYLSHLAWEGFKKRGLDSEGHRKRLELELSDIKLIYDTKQYDFATYFLIVEDIIRYTKGKDIPVDIRGSGNASLLLYCLNVSNIDPVKFSLLWNRFLGFSSQLFISDSDFGVK